MVLLKSTGLTKGEMLAMAEGLLRETVVFVSLAPLLLRELSFASGYGHDHNCDNANGALRGMDTEVLLFHNDKREKKELPNGKVIHVVAKEGWELL